MSQSMVEDISAMECALSIDLFICLFIFYHIYLLLTGILAVYNVF